MANRDNNSTGITVLAQQYLEALRARRYSPRSVETYGQALRDFISHVKKPDVRTIDRCDLERYRTELLDRRFKASSIAVYFQSLKLFFRGLEEKQVIFENPAAGLAAMRTPKPLQPVPTEEEMEILLAQPDVSTPTGVRDRALLETAYSTGVRSQELLALRVESLDLAAGRARVLGKGSRERMVPLGAEAVRWLQSYLEQARPALARKDADSLWLGTYGQALDENALHQIMLRHRTAPGIVTRIGLHSIRRACATHMLRRGASPAAIQILLGHASMQHLSQYLRLSLADIKRMHESSRVGQ